MRCALVKRMTAIGLACCGGLIGGSAMAQSTPAVVYRCPGTPVLYTDTLSAKEAKDKGCTSLEGAPITVIQGFKPRSSSAPAPVPSSTASPPGARIDPAAQRARDSDARRILEGELKREEERIAALKAEYNGGTPERRGDEKNYQKYVERVAELKASIARKESDIDALKRELSKTPQ